MSIKLNSSGTGLEIGELYHVYGWNFKAQFILESITGNIATLKYPKRNKRTHAPVDKLFYAKRTRSRVKGHIRNQLAQSADTKEETE